MKTVGEILKAARLEKNLSLGDISRETRITAKYLEAIEANDFDKLPPATFTKGFMQNYARCVGLDPPNVLAIFRRDYDLDERGRIIPRGLSEPVRSPINWFTPTTTTITLTAAIGVLVLAFFVRQIIQFQSAPDLVITSPTEKAAVISPVHVTGTTNPEASVTINQHPVTLDDKGVFTTDITLTQGEHTLVIISTGKGGKARTVQRVITVDKLPP